MHGLGPKRSLGKFDSVEPTSDSPIDQWTFDETEARLVPRKPPTSATPLPSLVRVLSWPLAWVVLNCTELEHREGRVVESCGQAMLGACLGSITDERARISEEDAADPELVFAQVTTTHQQLNGAIMMHCARLFGY